MNIQAVVNRFPIEYKIHDHGEFSTEIINRLNFAAAWKYPNQRITKAVFLCSRNNQMYAVAVCSADRRLNFKPTAIAIGVNRVEVASTEDLRVRTGYPRNGVSSLGLNADITVVIDQLLFDYPTVLIDDGATAIEIELSPSALALISGARVENITT